MFLEDMYISAVDIVFAPGLERVFVEALSNAIDNVWRSRDAGVTPTCIRVTVGDGETSVYNDGLAIPIRKDEKSGVYIPEMIFGRMLTSSNYTDAETRFTSGRNGIGIKALNIFSKVFRVACVDPESGQKYTQEWRDNMAVVDPPKIVKTRSQKASTTISWVPDFARFGERGYTADLETLYTRHVCDCAMITNVKTYYNGDLVRVKDLADYARLYDGVDEKHLLSVQTPSARVVFCQSSDPVVVSFVNGVRTSEGGVHADAWLEAFLRPLVAHFSKKRKVTVKDLRPYFSLFVEAPRPDAAIEAKHRNAVLRWPFAATLAETLDEREKKVLKKAGKRPRGFKKIDGYDPANDSTRRRRTERTLILCEGLSAKTYAVTGINTANLARRGRDYFGIYPLRGKLLNVRNASVGTIAKNREIMNLIHILGLETGVDYTADREYAKLNYGRVLLLTDQDYDGIHITGLILNAFAHLFPSLLKRAEPFVTTMCTPLVAVGSRLFYDLEEYRACKLRGKTKYYKGLGTSSDAEVRATFGKKMIRYAFDENAHANLRLAFDSRLANDRKAWLQTERPAMRLTETLDISDFVNANLIRYSLDDCKRSIPSVYDGLKESQRKILHACFLRNLAHAKESIKVAQLAGYVSEKTGYHHGEQCLFDTITKMAQDYVGSNNLPLLFADGQFGSRLSGGKDAASARYIYTKLNALTRLVFPAADDELLERVVEDGEALEPVHFLPILPMVLVNGVIAGIGTGWSCSVPAHDPLDVVAVVRQWIKSPRAEVVEPTPWYRGFRGAIARTGPDRFETRGEHERRDGWLVIKELPIHVWTDRYKEYLECLLEKRTIRSLQNHSTKDSVLFLVDEDAPLPPEALELTSVLRTSNMVFFDGVVPRRFTVAEIVQTFCERRLALYVQRREAQLKTLRAQLAFLRDKQRFLEEVMAGTLVVQRVATDEVEKALERRKFPRRGTYAYLLGLPVSSFTTTMLTKLAREIEEAGRRVAELERMDARDLWRRDLEEFERAYKSEINNVEMAK
jgi:DNA topoisomerase-2